MRFFQKIHNRQFFRLNNSSSKKIEKTNQLSLAKRVSQVWTDAQGLTYMPILNGVTNKNESYIHPINLIEVGSTNFNKIFRGVLFLKQIKSKSKSKYYTS